MFKFWIDTGVDGLYLDKVQYLFEDVDFKNNTVNVINNLYDNKATSNLVETNNLLSEWGKLIGNNSG